MKSLDQIRQELESKVQHLSQAASQVQTSQEEDVRKSSEISPEQILDRLSDSDLDDVLKSTVEAFLKQPKPKAKPKKRKRRKTKDKAPVDVPNKPIKPKVQLTFDLIQKAYEATGLKPYRAVYWFYEDTAKYPLIQRSAISEDGTCATPLAAYTLMKRAELLASNSPPTFITNYRDLEKPSHTWTAGRVSQVSGLDISYILGFDNGYDGNAPGHPNCSKLYHTGYEDGLQVQRDMIDRGLIEPSPVEDIYADETDEHILSELYRVRGYVRGGEWKRW